MKMSLASQIFSDAEELKSSLAEEKPSNAEAIVGRQKIQDLYQRLLLMDLEFALDKKVETDLWNVSFKNVIDGYQVKVKEKNVQKRAENQASLSLFLEAASGFYFQLMQDVCCAFELDVPFRRKSSRFGILNEPSPVAFEIKKPKKSSCFYLLQHILVHLGDIARYKKDMKQAEIFYNHAAQLIPTNGQPFNQLALLDMHKGNKLATVYHYIRSVAVKHPFPAAETNLHKFYERLSKEIPSSRQKSPEEKFVKTFLTFASLLHLRENLPKAKESFSSLTAMICTNGILSKLPLSSLHHFVVIGIFTLHRAREIKEEPALDNDAEGEEEVEEVELVGDELEVYELTLSFLITVASDLILETIAMKSVQVTQKNLQVIKLVLAYISQSKKVLEGSWVKEKSQFWPHLSNLMNSLQKQTEVLQLSAAQITKLKTHPLSDETSLQGFLPMARHFKSFDLTSWRKSLTESDGSQSINQDVEVTRSVHVLELGRRVAESLRNLRLLSLEETKSGKMNFHSGIQVTDDHRFSDKIPSSSTTVNATSSPSTSAFAPSEFRPQQQAPPRNPNLGPRFNKIHRQNVALQSFMASLSSESPTPESENRRQPSPPSAFNNNADPPSDTNNGSEGVSTATSSSFSSTSRGVTFVPPPRMSANRQTQQQTLYNPNKAPSPPLPTGPLPEDTRGKKNNQLFQVKKEEDQAAEDFPALLSTTKTSKVMSTGSSFFSSSSSSNSAASLSSSLSATVNKNHNYSLFSQNLPSWTPTSIEQQQQQQHQQQQQQQQQHQHQASSINFAVPPPAFPPHLYPSTVHRIPQHPPQQQHPAHFPSFPYSGPGAQPHAPTPTGSVTPRPGASGGVPVIPNASSESASSESGQSLMGHLIDSSFSSPRDGLLGRPPSTVASSRTHDVVEGNARPAFGGGAEVFEDSRWKFPGGESAVSRDSVGGPRGPLPPPNPHGVNVPFAGHPMAPNIRQFGAFPLSGSAFPGGLGPADFRGQSPTGRPGDYSGRRLNGNEKPEDTPALGGNNAGLPRDNNQSKQQQQQLHQRHHLQLQNQQLQQRLDQERLQQERLQQERLLQERRQQERLLQERQQMMMANQFAMQSNSNNPRPGDNYGSVFSSWGSNPGFGAGEHSMGGAGGAAAVGGSSALEKLIQEQRKHNQETDS